MNNGFFKKVETKSAYVEKSAYITTKRTWGFSVMLDANACINFIKGEPSAHFHIHRTEDYILYSGELEVYRGKWHPGDLEMTIAGLEKTRLLPGDRVVIHPGTVHIPINLAPSGSVFIEISHGPYIESDVNRVYDKDGRDIELAKQWSELGYKGGVGITKLIPLVRKKLTITKKK